MGKKRIRLRCSPTLEVWIRELQKYKKPLASMARGLDRGNRPPGNRIAHSWAIVLTASPACDLLPPKNLRLPRHGRYFQGRSVIQSLISFPCSACPRLQKGGERVSFPRLFLLLWQGQAPGTALPRGANCPNRRLRNRLFSTPRPGQAAGGPQRKLVDGVITRAPHEGLVRGPGTHVVRTRRIGKPC
jgi:hypothetical protein